jgi:actin-related protein
MNSPLGTQISYYAGGTTKTLGLPERLKKELDAKVPASINTVLIADVERDLASW